MKINLIEYFEKTVHFLPQKPAVFDGASTLNFSELQQKAKIVSAIISKKNKSINNPVAVYLPKSNGAIVAFLGTLYSGNCYAPLDIKNPTNRIKSIVQALKPICIITNNNYIEHLAGLNLNIDRKSTRLNSSHYS